MSDMEQIKSGVKSIEPAIDNVTGYISDVKFTPYPKYDVMYAEPVISYAYTYSFSTQLSITVLSSRTFIAHVVDTELHTTKPFEHSRVWEDLARTNQFRDLESGSYICDFVQSSFFCRGKFTNIQQVSCL
jgi:hypothetical protein